MPREPIVQKHRTLIDIPAGQACRVVDVANALLADRRALCRVFPRHSHRVQLREVAGRLHDAVTESGWTPSRGRPPQIKESSTEAELARLIRAMSVVLTDPCGAAAHVFPDGAQRRHADRAAHTLMECLERSRALRLFGEHAVHHKREPRPVENTQRTARAAARKARQRQRKSRRNR